MYDQGVDQEKEPRKAVREDLLLLLRSLAHHQVDYVIIGGQALNLHGYMRNTDDIDILLPMDAVNGKKVIDALSVLPDNAAKDVDPEWLAEPGTVRVADEIIVDLMTLAANGETYDSLSAHIQKAEMEGFSYYLLDVDGLIRTKQSVRPKDRQDLEILYIMQRNQRNVSEDTVDALPNEEAMRLRDAMREKADEDRDSHPDLTVSPENP